MCGIAGWVSTVPERLHGDAIPLAERMAQQLRHRGPDDSGIFLDVPDNSDQLGGCVLAFRRLSIVDLGGGHQPMGNEDGQVQVVFNGEIYNHLELRKELEAAGHRFASHADTEVLVHGWEQWGTALLPRLNGMFDLAIWDGHKRSLLLARDRFGKKPLFVAAADGGKTLVFATELQAVRAHPAVDGAVDPRGLWSLLTLDYIASPRSILKQVHTLEPGSFWLWQAPQGHGQAVLTQGQWYAPAPVDAQLAALPEKEALAELDRRLLRATERRLMADVPLGIFLSGGIDSSLVAWYAAQLRPAGDLDTFAIGFEDKSFDESSHARTVARHLGTRHHERVLSAEQALALVPWVLERLDQPLADPSIIPTAFLCQFARERVTVALGGDGGDEWFLGYPTFGAHKLAALWDRLGLGLLQPLAAKTVGMLPVSSGNWSLEQQAKRFVAGLAEPVAQRHFAWIGGMPAAQAGQLLHPDLQQALLQEDLSPGPRRPEPAEVLAETWRQWRLFGRDDLDALAPLYARFYLADGVLQKVDRASMLHSLEARAPLLDPEVVALARALPSRSKLRGGTTKWALRQLAQNKLPAEITARPKKGFGVPLSEWLRGPLKGWMTDTLSEKALAETGLINALGAQKLIADHLARRADHRKPLWALLGLMTWLQRQPPRS